MTYTPFEREMLKRADRTNELLELLVMAHRPMKVMTGALMPGEETIKADRLVQEAEAGKVSIEQALAAAGIVPMAKPRSGRPPTDEERSARFTERAREVGMPPDVAEQVSARVQLNLDNLTRPVTADEVSANIEGLIDELAEREPGPTNCEECGKPDDTHLLSCSHRPAENGPPVKKPGPRRKAAPPAG